MYRGPIEIFERRIFQVFDFKPTVRRRREKKNKLFEKTKRLIEKHAPTVSVRSVWLFFVEYNKMLFLAEFRTQASAVSRHRRFIRPGGILILFFFPGR